MKCKVCGSWHPNRYCNSEPVCQFCTGWYHNGGPYPAKNKWWTHSASPEEKAAAIERLKVLFTECR